MVAIVEAINNMQEPSGKWPASHPIVRERPKGPWYIASPELALCLTWLYFQPKLPDPARRLILLMLERHFRNWIIPTYRDVRDEADSQKVFSGWFDDSAMGQDKVVGWATAIVCHLLANYVSVLDDHINRAVVESLELQNVSTSYLIDEIAKERNPRWSTKEPSDRNTRPWPDLPPKAWVEPMVADDLARQISLSWPDPERNCKLSVLLAEHVLLPILSKPNSLPASNRLAGILDGPPGTGKTILVKVLAKTLSWPYVPVPASTIFDSGFDSMEARATIVFRHLNYLTRCVVFFDEFEEFFRDRKEVPGASETLEGVTSVETRLGQSATVASRAVPPSEFQQSNDASRFSPHDRTIAAFTTSAMLARMQDLHDAGRSLIFLATNHFDKLDDAIVRTGRFDFKESIDHPTVCRFNGEGGSYLLNPTQRTLLRLKVNAGSSELSKINEVIANSLHDPSVKALLDSLQAKLVEDGSRPDGRRITFYMIEAAASVVAKMIRESHSSDRQLRAVAVEELERQIPRMAKRQKGPGSLLDL